MGEVTRYDLTEDVNTGVVDITPVPNTMEGRYVTFEDYAEEKHRADQNAAYLETLTERMLDAEKENAALQKKLDAVLAENVSLKSERAQMVEIGELIRTQNNRITDQPFFAVMKKREMVVSEDHDYDRICWVENQSGDYVEATETQHRRLEAIYQGKYEVREGWDRYAMKEVDVFVTGCFTEHGCKDYISRNAHNLNKPFIYAFGSYRNNEYQAVRKFIMDLPVTPATDAILNAVRAEGGPSVQDSDLKALLRFNETSEDGEGYDIDDEAMNRLVELGMVAKERAGMRVITSFGMWVIAREQGEEVSVLETQRDRDSAFQRKIDQLRAGINEGATHD